MSGAPRITAESVERFEYLMDTFREINADGTITAEEEALYSRLKEDMYQFLLYIDESMKLLTTGLRRGHASPSFQRQLGNINPRHRRRINRQNLSVMEGGKGKKSEPLDAA